MNDPEIQATQIADDTTRAETRSEHRAGLAALGSLGATVLLGVSTLVSAGYEVATGKRFDATIALGEATLLSLGVTFVAVSSIGDRSGENEPAPRFRGRLHRPN